MKQTRLPLFLLALLMLSGVVVNAQRVTVTVAGNGSSGFSGDGAWGKLAAINGPYDVCMDASQNIYFTDTGNGRVRKISALNGKIYTIAGGGTSTADGIPAVQASISPTNMCIDAAGNIYVVASRTQIKKISAATGIITTVAGIAAGGFSGDGGPAISAAFGNINGIAIDATGNIYAVDQGNQRVREITAAGIVNTIAGNGTAGFSGDGGPAAASILHNPTTITVDGSGNVFFIDQSTWSVFASRLRKIDATGNINTVAGGGSGPVFGVSLLTTMLGYVTGICLDDSGNCYCNEISCSCRELDFAEDMTYNAGGNFGIESYADNVNAQIGYMNNPYGICIDAARNVYTADFNNNRVRKLIQVTTTPTYAFGKSATLSTCPGGVVTFDSLLAITDLDASQTETYTVLTAPAHGTLSGFPTTTLSNADNGIAFPTGVSYTASSTFMGTDKFQVQVSDGTTTDVITIYIDNGVATPTAPSSVCLGAATQVSDDFSGGTWSLSNTNASVTTAGVLTGAIVGTDVLTYSVINACGEMSSSQIINITSTADAGHIVEPGTTICNGSSMLLADAVSGGVWSTINGHTTISTGGIVTGASVGIDTVIYTVTGSCGRASASAAVSVMACVTEGVAAVAAPVPAIYPNPASATLSIRWDALSNSSAAVTLSDVTGRTILQRQVANHSSNSTELDVSSIAEGVYLLNITAGSEEYTGKVTISR